MPFILNSQRLMTCLLVALLSFVGISTVQAEADKTKNWAALKLGMDTREGFNTGWYLAGVIPFYLDTSKQFGVEAEIAIRDADAEIGAFSMTTTGIMLNAFYEFKPSPKLRPYLLRRGLYVAKLER